MAGVAGLPCNHRYAKAAISRGRRKPGGSDLSAPAADVRDALLKAFAKALFTQDIDALYQVVTPDFVWSLPIGPTAPFARRLGHRKDLADYFVERDRLYEKMRFADVVFHHAPDVTLMTFRVTGVWRATNASFEMLGMEQYRFRDGKICLKDAYWKRIGDEQALAAPVSAAAAAKA
jgi:ketosteroid isomerase-like protein